MPQKRGAGHKQIATSSRPGGGTGSAYLPSPQPPIPIPISIRNQSHSHPRSPAPIFDSIRPRPPNARAHTQKAMWEKRASSPDIYDWKKSGIGSSVMKGKRERKEKKGRKHRDEEGISKAVEM